MDFKSKKWTDTNSECALDIQKWCQVFSLKGPLALSALHKGWPVRLAGLSLRMSSTLQLPPTTTSSISVAIYH